MRTPRPLPALALLLVLGPWAAGAEQERIELEAPRTVHGLRIADANGDGCLDVLVLEGRRLSFFPGRKGRLPAAAPAWTGPLPDAASFVDVAPGTAGSTPTLLALGTQGLGSVLLGAGSPVAALPEARPLTWRDSSKATFARLARPGGLLLPGEGGWAFVPADGGPRLALATAPTRAVRAPGPFLEDSCAVTVTLPDVFVGTPAGARHEAGARALWTLDGLALIAQARGERTAYDLSFLRAAQGQGEVDQQLVDLDGDGRPEILHRIHTNRETRYGFFRTRPVEAEDAAWGPTHNPAASDVHLAGFQPPPDLVDLDGDGLPDLVVTSIQIDPANTLRALSAGKVTAETRAFLNRWRDGDGRFFRGEADATIRSDIDVRVRFNYAGTIEVERSFTILLTGDYDGDGRRDLAIRTGPDEITVRRGVAQGAWDAEGRRHPIPPLGGQVDVDGHTADVDGDGKDEVVLLYRGPPGGHDQLWVLRLGS